MSVMPGMVWPSFGQVGQFLGGLGSFAGALGGLFGGGGGGTDWAAINRQEYFLNNQMRAQMEFQREMAQHGIQYRVDDAIRAGVSPLAALGAPTFSPTISVGGAPDYSSARSGGSSLPASIKAAGQGLGDMVRSFVSDEKERSIASVMHEHQRTQLNDLEIQFRGAQIRALEKQMERMDRPSVVSRSGGLSGQQSSQTFGDFEMKAPEITKTQVGSGSGTVEGGPPIADTRWMKTPTGVRPFPAKGTLDDTDIFNPEYINWGLRVYAAPHAGRAPTPEYMSKVFPGSVGARWNQFELEYQPVYPPKKSAGERPSWWPDTSVYTGRR